MPKQSLSSYIESAINHDDHKSNTDSGVTENYQRISLLPNSMYCSIVVKDLKRWEELDIARTILNDYPNFI